MKWIRNNSLSIVFFLFFFFTLIGQVLTGFTEHNKELQEEGGTPVSMPAYLTSGHFLEVTFENFESEFLQMALFVVFSAFLFQVGSSESKDPEGYDEVDNEPNPNKEGAPWPVKKGGIILGLYKYSLSIALFLLFAVSFAVHLYGSLKHHNEEQALKGQPTETVAEYVWGSKFWFESLQNWQSEFLSVLTIVLLSIWLRHKGSAQSKPVDAPNSQTGE